MSILDINLQGLYKICHHARTTSKCPFNPLYSRLQANYNPLSWPKLDLSVVKMVLINILNSAFFGAHAGGIIGQIIWIDRAYLVSKVIVKTSKYAKARHHSRRSGIVLLLSLSATVYSASISGANEPRWEEVTVAHVGGLPLCWRLRFTVSDRALGQGDAYLLRQ